MNNYSYVFYDILKIVNYLSYSIRVNQLDIAEYAVLQAQKDRNFENWMNCTDVWENFLHEAFKKGVKRKF